MAEDERIVIEQSGRDIAALDAAGAKMALEFKASEAYMVLNGLQAALRSKEIRVHPAVYEFVSGLAKNIERRISKTPAIAAAAALGWKAQEDSRMEKPEEKKPDEAPWDAERADCPQPPAAPKRKPEKTPTNKAIDPPANKERRGR